MLPLFRYGVPIVLSRLRYALVVLMFVLLVSFLSACVLLGVSAHLCGTQGKRDLMSVFDRSRYVHFRILGLRLCRISFEGAYLIHFMFVVRFNVGKRGVLLGLLVASVLRFRQLGNIDGRAAYTFRGDVEVARRVSGLNVKRRLSGLFRASHVEQVLAGGLNSIHVPGEGLCRFSRDLLGCFRLFLYSIVGRRMFVNVLLLVFKRRPRVVVNMKRRVYRDGLLFLQGIGNGFRVIHKAFIQRRPARILLRRELPPRRGV